MLFYLATTFYSSCFIPANCSIETGIKVKVSQKKKKKKKWKNRWGGKFITFSAVDEKMSYIGGSCGNYGAWEYGWCKRERYDMVKWILLKQSKWLVDFLPLRQLWFAPSDRTFTFVSVCDVFFFADASLCFLLHWCLNNSQTDYWLLSHFIFTMRTCTAHITFCEHTSNIIRLDIILANEPDMRRWSKWTLSCFSMFVIETFHD